MANSSHSQSQRCIQLELPTTYWRASPGSYAGRAVAAFLTSVIALNVGMLIIGTVEGVYERAPEAFWAFEAASVAIFTVEYLLRLWSCTVNPKYASPVLGRLRYALSPMALIDLAAILPFYVGLLYLTRIDLRFLRAVRLLARIVRVSQHTSAIGTLLRVFSAKSTELLTTVGVLLVLLIMASSLMYFAESGAQPEAFSSIPETMWWAVITLTTVGYGDLAPVTVAGKMLAGVIAVLGIGMFALPAGILGSGFVSDMDQRKEGTPYPKRGRCRGFEMTKDRLAKCHASVRSTTHLRGSTLSMAGPGTLDDLPTHAGSEVQGLR